MELVLRLAKAIRSLGLTRRAVARRIGTTQPELLKILRGKFTEVSFERLMRFLTALGYHIEIKIGAGKARRVGRLRQGCAARSVAQISSRCWLAARPLLYLNLSWPNSKDLASRPDQDQSRTYNRVHTNFFRRCKCEARTGK